jgi:hypothetical protein
MLMTLATTRSNLAAAADWSGTLDSNATLAYVTNPALLPGADVADRLAQFALDGHSMMQTELDQLTITPRFALSRYDRETNLNVNTGSLDVQYLGQLERGNWNFAGQALTDSTVTSELGSTGVTDVNLHHYLYTTSLGYTYQDTELLSWQVQGVWQDTRYSDAQKYGLTDYQYLSAQFGPTLSLTANLFGSLILEADRITPDVGIRQDVYSANIQLKHSLTEQYVWHVSGGLSNVNAGIFGSATTSVAEVGISRQGERIHWDLAAKRAVVPIGFGLVARQDTATFDVIANTSEYSTLTVAVSAIRSDPVVVFNFLFYTGATYGQVTTEWKYNFTPHWALSASYVQARARGSVDEWGISNQARLNLFWTSGRL